MTALSTPQRCEVIRQRAENLGRIVGGRDGCQLRRNQPEIVAAQNIHAFVFPLGCCGRKGPHLALAAKVRCVGISLKKDLLRRGKSPDSLGFG